MTRQVGWALIFISLLLKAKLCDSTLYLQSLYIWPLASSNYPHTFLSQLLHFLFNHHILLFYFFKPIPSAVFLYRLISALFVIFSLSLWNKYGSCRLKDHPMTHSPQCMSSHIHILYLPTNRRSHRASHNKPCSPGGCRQLKGMCVCVIKWEKSHICQFQVNSICILWASQINTNWKRKSSCKRLHYWPCRKKGSISQLKLLWSNPA